MSLKRSWKCLASRFLGSNNPFCNFSVFNMSDVFSRKKRSEIMSRIRSTHSIPEERVLALLDSMKIKFQYQDKGLPGRPDFVFKRRKKIIFVNGCFWHSHKGCSRATKPKSNKTYWKEKLERNERRDRSNIRSLKRAGWSVLVVWECETKISKLQFLKKKLADFLKER